MVKKNNSFVRIIVNLFAVALVFLFGGFFATNAVKNNLIDNPVNNSIPNVLGFSDNENSYKYVVFDNQIFGYEEWLSNISV